MEINITEKQRFKNPYIWSIVILLNCYIIYGLMTQLFFNNPFGDHPAPDIILIFSFITTLTVLLLLLSLYLEINIQNNKISVRFFPFLKKVFDFQDIKGIDIVRYSPLKDYGGWGIRHGKKGFAYTVGGNLGLKITLVNNKTYLIGIENEEKFKPLKQVKL